MATLTLGVGKRVEARVVALETQVNACMLHAVKVGILRADDPRLETNWLRDGLVATIRMQLGELRWGSLPEPVKAEVAAITGYGRDTAHLLDLSPACLVVYALAGFILPSSSELMRDDPALVEYVMEILRDAHDAATCGRIEPTAREWAILNSAEDYWLAGSNG